MGSSRLKKKVGIIEMSRNGLTIRATIETHAAGRNSPWTGDALNAKAAGVIALVNDAMRGPTLWEPPAEATPETPEPSEPAAP